MNWHSHIDQYGGTLIVPVYCGTSQGTAFFVGSNQLLTATHVLSDADFGDGISILVEGKKRSCGHITLSNDISLLICDDYSMADSPIPLLATKFYKDIPLEIIGFPQEIGNGVDFLSVKVKNLKEFSSTETHSFDVMVVRTDAFGLHSYVGYSGSPVLNNEGMAVGVATDQFNNSLGYTSIKNIVDSLHANSIPCEENGALYDTTPYGLGTSISKVNEAVEKAASRHNKRHVKNTKFEKDFRLFCVHSLEENYLEIRGEFIKWLHELKTELRSWVLSYGEINAFISGETIDEMTFASSIEKILYKRHSERSDDYRIDSTNRERLTEWYDKYVELQSNERLNKKQFMCVSGDAGSGKTHMLCQMALELCHTNNVYLFFGTDFAEPEPVMTFARIMGWKDYDPLEALNDAMQIEGKRAILIIDALNEGSGEMYWKLKLPPLVSKIQTLSNLKLIVSYRSLSDGDTFQELFKKQQWYINIISGFENVENAMSVFFEINGIKENPQKFLPLAEFSNPLFLKVFCDTYWQLTPEEINELSRITIYNRYLSIRNKDISDAIGEDPYANAAPRYLHWLAKRSVENFACGDVPRDVAKKKSYQQCVNRIWKNSLLNSLLQHNLLKSHDVYEKGNLIGFEFQDMGDYLKAEQMLFSSKSDKEMVRRLVSLINDIKSHRYSRNDSRNIVQMLVAFLAEWNPSPEIWTKDEFLRGVLKPLLIQSFHYRKIDSPKSTITTGLVQEFIRQNADFLNAEFLLQHYEIFLPNLLDTIHSILMPMSIMERDEKWTIGVNKLLDEYRYSYLINEAEQRYEPQDILFLEVWLLTSSHPQLRYNVLRRIQRILTDNHELSIALVDKFHEVNDPYVAQGIYAAIYGMLLKVRDKSIANQLSDKIYQYHYSSPELIPQDVITRKWTLKILEFANHLDANNIAWEKVKLPFLPQKNVFAFEEEEDYDKEYFGTGRGADALHMSLFSWDFNRYIIGTNSTGISRTYINPETGEGVALDAITHAIAHIIKYDIGYSNVLDDYDATVAWENRHTHLHERIGKKYQWIGLWTVKAYLCDTCKIKPDFWGDRFAETPYPWYDDHGLYFDPTLDLINNNHRFDAELFESIQHQDLSSVDAQIWFDSSLPTTEQIVKDRSGNEWVVLVGYDKNESENEKLEDFVFINSCLVKESDASAFRDWAVKQNFYGRWMPEAADVYEFLWNEFPWSDSCRMYLSPSERQGIPNGCPCSVILPYADQLQEYCEEIEDEEFFDTTVYMPSVELMTFMNGYTAERGIIRHNETKDILAIYRRIRRDAMNALVIRRDILNRFLQEYNYVLFYCQLAEKRMAGDHDEFHMKRYSSCYEYNPTASPVAVQPMTEESSFEQPEFEIEEENDDMFRILLEGITRDNDTITLHTDEKD